MNQLIHISSVRFSRENIRNDIYRSRAALVGWPQHTPGGSSIDLILKYMNHLHLVLLCVRVFVRVSE